MVCLVMWYVHAAENSAETTESDIVTLLVSGSKYITDCVVVPCVVWRVTKLKQMPEKMETDGFEPWPSRSRNKCLTTKL